MASVTNHTKNNLPTVKTAVVSGAAGTLGKAISRELARRGYALALADCDIDGIRSLETELNQQSEYQRSGGHVTCYQLDVTNPADWQALHDDVRNRWPNLDVLVNAAGCMVAGELAQTTWEQWSRVVNVNLLGTGLGCHTFAEWLSGSPHPSHVLNVGSVASFVPLPWGSAYAVSKAGVLALSESLQAEWQPRSVCVTTVCPAFFESGLFASGEYANELSERVTQFMVGKAKLTADEVASASIQAMECQQRYVIMPAKARWLYRLKRLAPGWLVSMVSRRAHGLRARLRRELAEEAKTDSDRSV